jgi:hypothetical protein
MAESPLPQSIRKLISSQYRVDELRRQQCHP